MTLFQCRIGKIRRYIQQKRLLSSPPSALFRILTKYFDSLFTGFIAFFIPLIRLDGYFEVPAIRKLFSNRTFSRLDDLLRLLHGCGFFLAAAGTVPLALELCSTSSWPADCRHAADRDHLFCAIDANLSEILDHHHTTAPQTFSTTTSSPQRHNIITADRKAHR